MSVLRRLISVGAGIAAGAFAYKILQVYNDKNQIEGDYIEVPLEKDCQPEPEKAEAPVWQPRPDNGPLVNPVSLGTAEKPLTDDGKLDPTRIACAEDFGDWDDMGCQS